MRVFERLRAIRAYEREHLHLLRTIEDFNLVREIGYHQARGEPLTLKQLFLLDTGSIATVQRRLRRLRETGVIQQRKSGSDRRSVELRLSAKFLKVYRAYGHLLFTPESSLAPRHVCGLYTGAQARAQLMGKFLLEGLRKGEGCVLLAPAAVQEELLRELGEKRRHVLVSDGASEPQAMLAYWKRVFAQARNEERRLRVAADMGWARARGLDDATVIELETRLDALARQFPVQVLCGYDCAAFNGATLLRALKAHRDTARFPIRCA